MKRRIAGAMVFLMIASAALFAADASKLREDFTAALESGDAAQAIESYSDMLSQVQKDHQKAQRSYEKALDAGNMQKAREAWYEMNAVSYSAMTRDETDQLLSLIIAEDEPQRAEDAAWLMENSRYYRPSVSFEWSASGDSYSFRYSSSRSVVPGEDLVLPDADSMRVDTSAAGVLVGWGVTPGEIMYQPGETIKAPYTDQTFYAVWETRVVFRDELTNTESTISDAQDDDAIAVPSLTAPDGSYVFAGWVDRSTGEYIAPDETEVVLEGNGAYFEALWKNAQLVDAKARHYSIDAIPAGTQADISFTIENNGTEDIRDAEVVCSGSDGLSVLRTNGSIRRIGADSSVAVQGVRVVATEPGSYTLHATLTDRDGDVWSADFPVTMV